MQTYLKRIAGALNAALLVIMILVVAGDNANSGAELLIFLLGIITPAFTLFALFAPPGH